MEVERDFSDLPNKMANLLDHPEKAQKIADNSVNIFRDKYLSPAADACYWRTLWHTYSKVSEQAKLWTSDDYTSRQKRGLRFETFVLLSNEQMLDFKVHVDASS